MEISFLIFVPVYKTEKYLAACFDSLISQTCGDFRVIAVDDGSPDASGEICDRYAAKDARFTVIHKENGGLISARRAAVDYARENFQEDSFVLFVDSDDTLKPNALETLSRIIGGGDCDAVVFGFDRMTDDGLFDPEAEMSPFIGTVTDKRELYRLVFMGPYNAICRKCVSLSGLGGGDYSRFYGVSMGEDLLQSIPIYKNCKKMAFIPDRLYNYRMNTSSITMADDPAKYEINSAVRAEVRSFLQGENVWNDGDWEDYGAFMRGELDGIIRRILSFRVPYRRTRDMLRRVAEDPYYKTVAQSAHPYDGYVYLLGREKYLAVVMRYRREKFYRKLRKLFGEKQNG